MRGIKQEKFQNNKNQFILNKEHPPSTTCVPFAPPPSSTSGIPLGIFQISPQPKILVKSIKDPAPYIFNPCAAMILNPDIWPLV